MQTERSTLTLPGVTLGYNVRGEGPPVLLVMGLAMPADAWHHQIQDLSRDHRVCWFDNRGVGRSSSPGGLYSTDQMARDAHALLDHLGWDRVHVVGVSMGGMISQHITLQQPDRVRSLTLLASSPMGRSVRPTREGLRRWLQVQTSKDVATRQRAMGRLLFSDKTLAERPNVMGDLNRDLAAGRAQGWGLFAQTWAALSHRAGARLEAVRHVPSLVVVGQDDVLVRPTNSQTLATLLDAELVEIPDAGHGVAAEAHPQVNAAIRGLFERS